MDSFFTIGFKNDGKNKIFFNKLKLIYTQTKGRNFSKFLFLTYL